MSKSIVFIINIVVVIIAIIFLTYYGYMYHKNNKREFSCVANFVQHNHDSKVSLLVNYVFGKREGYLGLNGKIEGKGIPTQTISRNIIFSYRNEGDNYFLTFEKSTLFPTDTTNNAVLKRVSPLFFTEPDRNIFMRIVYQSNDHYFFYIGPIVTYACKRV